MVTSGRVDAYATEDILLYGLISKDRNPEQYQVTGRFLKVEHYALMVSKNDSTFQQLGNEVLADLIRSGEINTIYERWFNPGPTNIKIPLSDAQKKVFANLTWPQ